MQDGLPAIRLTLGPPWPKRRFGPSTTWVYRFVGKKGRWKREETGDLVWELGVTWGVCCKLSKNGGFRVPAEYKFNLSDCSGSQDLDFRFQSMEVGSLRRSCLLAVEIDCYFSSPSETS